MSPKQKSVCKGSFCQFTRIRQFSENIGLLALLQGQLVRLPGHEGLDGLDEGAVPLLVDLFLGVLRGLRGHGLGPAAPLTFGIEGHQPLNGLVVVVLEEGQPGQEVVDFRQSFSSGQDSFGVFEFGHLYQIARTVVDHQVTLVAKKKENNFE